MRSLATLCLCKHEVAGPGRPRARQVKSLHSATISPCHIHGWNAHASYLFFVGCVLKLGPIACHKNITRWAGFPSSDLVWAKTVFGRCSIGLSVDLPCFSCSNPFVTYLPPPSAMCDPSRPTFVARCRSGRGDTVAAAASVVAPFRRPSNWFVKGERARNTV